MMYPDKMDWLPHHIHVRKVLPIDDRDYSGDNMINSARTFIRLGNQIVHTVRVSR